MAFESELVLQRPDDCLNALPQPVREGPGLFLVLAGGADQGQVQVRAGEEFLGVLAGQKVVDRERYCRRRRLRGPGTLAASPVLRSRRQVKAAS